MVRACLDTNVWISGIVFGGAPAKIVQLAFEKKFVVITSGAILKELGRVLEAKFDVSAKDVERLSFRITQIADVYEPPGELKVIVNDPDDDLILETAVVGKARYLVSGDKRHLLPLKSYGGVTILSPKDFLPHIPN
jgi:putative PIN family toxin of toxin-antitoxin system